MRREAKLKINGLPLTWTVKSNFILFIGLIDISDKKLKTFLNLKDRKKSVGFLYKLLIHNAYKYGVPKVYINECILSKKLYKSNKKKGFLNFNNSQNQYRHEMNKKYYNLLIAVNELVSIKISRRHKIETVLEKIYDKNN